ncbi:MAG: bifunctional diaminohydroxyphosphoribosylaminopyrimidine deaminase/5-amino-6-(5-phosphoribosylamino)uracil reductase RibD [Phycisphaeraceae bacterium]
MIATEHVKFMRRALRLARRGQGRVEPNPMVGCVLARDGAVVAQGWHQHFGGPHAEIVALRQAAQRSVNVSACDLYVTLEPCCHHGKTPPCTEALIAARPRRVVVAMADPFPLVAGRGIAALRQAGIDVEVGIEEDQSRELNAPFIKRVATGRPWTIAKWAQTLDGRTATRSGESKWISNPNSRMLVHRLRARVDAVMVGIRTVLADDPQLTARDVRVCRIARRVVVDPDLRLPESAALLRTLGSAPLTLAVRQTLLNQPTDRVGQLRAQGVEIIGLPTATELPGRLALTPLMNHLAQQHAATNVLVEGGATLIGTMLEEHLVDQVLAFVAPMIVGDAQALPAVVGRELLHMHHAHKLTLHSVKRIEHDLLLDYRVNNF